MMMAMMMMAMMMERPQSNQPPAAASRLSPPCPVGVIGNGLLSELGGVRA